MSERAARPPATGSGWRPLLIGLLLFAGLVWLFRSFTVDDAFIAYRHARNLARGLGPVMNPGERVEGVSNLPWTLFLGAVAWFGPPPHVVGRWLSLLCGVACIVVTARTAARAGGPGAGAVGAAVGAAGVPLAVWSASGMETAAAALALVLALAASLRAHAEARAAVGLGSALGLVAGLRPEGAMFLLPGLLWSARSPGPRTRRALWILAGFAIAWGPFFALRRIYYGAWLPNPVLAKLPEGWAALAPGALYALKLVGSFPLAFAACLVRPRERAAASSARLGRDLVLMQLLFTVLVGGDHFAGYRFGAVVWPLLAVMVALAAQGWGRGAPPAWSRRAAIAAAGLLALGAVCVARPSLVVPLSERVAGLGRLQRAPAEHVERLAGEVLHLGLVLSATGVWLCFRRARQRVSAGGTREARLALAVWLICALLPAGFDPQVRACRQADAASRYGRLTGEYLGRTFPQTTLVATNAAGSLPYFSELPVIDMLGLTDRHIARARPDASRWVGHERGDAASVLARRPALIILGGPEGSATPGPFPGDHQLAADPAFRRDYELQRQPLEGFDFLYFRRRAPEEPGRAPAGL